jgi:hypothetical protein
VNRGKKKGMDTVWVRCEDLGGDGGSFHRVLLPSPASHVIRVSEFDFIFDEDISSFKKNYDLMSRHLEEMQELKKNLDDTLFTLEALDGCVDMAEEELKENEQNNC